MAEEKLKSELRHVGKHFELKEFFQDLKVIKPEKPVGFVEWVQKYTFLKGKPFSFDKHEYQKEILADTHPLQCIKKSVQLGVSETLIRKFLAFMAMNQGTQGIYTFPTSEDMRNFVKTRFDAVIKDCAKIEELGFNVDNVKVKQIGTSYAHFRGSFGEKETLSIPSDFNCFEKGTEILTAEGWKKIELLTLDDLVATRNPAGKVEWHAPYQLIDKEYEGDMVVFKHQLLDFICVTPEHHMFVNNELIEAKRLVNKTVNMISLLGDKEYITNWHVKKITNFKGKVYCLTVKNHIVMVRGINEKTPIWTGQCHDEIDFSKPNIQNLYRSRLEHSAFKWEINCSTPTIPQYAIDEMFEESDQRYWHVRCNACNFWQVMTWLPEKGKVDQNSIRIKGNLSAHIDKFNQKLEYIFVCKKCNKPIYYNLDTVKMEWITKHPDRTISRGYFLNALVGWGYKTAGSIIASFYGYKEIDKAYNRILGLAYSDPGRKLSRDNILKCVNKDMELQFVGRNCFLAADQGSPSWVIIGEYDKIKDKIKVLYFEKVENNLFDHVGKGGTVEKGRISELMEKFDVLSAVIDAQPNTESAYAFAKQHPGKVWLCFYSDKQMAKYNWKPDDFVVVANRTRTLDYSVKYWLDKKVEIFPQDNYNYEIYEVLIKHLTSMTKVIDENEDGTRTARWTGPQDTHFAHVWNYLCMATEADSNVVSRIIDPSLSGFSMNK